MKRIWSQQNLLLTSYGQSSIYIHIYSLLLWPPGMKTPLLVCVCVPVPYSYKWSHWEFRHQYHSVISRECVINIHVAAVCATLRWNTRWGERNVTHLFSLDVMMIQVPSSIPVSSLHPLCSILFVEGDEWKHIVNQFLNERERLRCDLISSDCTQEHRKVLWGISNHQSPESNKRRSGTEVRSEQYRTI